MLKGLCMRKHFAECWNVSINSVTWLRFCFFKDGSQFLDVFWASSSGGWFCISNMFYASSLYIVLYSIAYKIIRIFQIFLILEIRRSSGWFCRQLASYRIEKHKTIPNFPNILNILNLGNTPQQWLVLQPTQLPTLPIACSSLHLAITQSEF